MKILALADFQTPEGMMRSELSLPDTALVKDGKPVFLPFEEREYIVRPTAILRVCKLGKKVAPRFIGRYVDAVAACGWLTDTLEMERARRLGLPLTPSCGFDCSCAAGAFQSASAEEISRFSFTLQAGESCAAWATETMAPDWQERLADLSERHTFRMGDFIMLPAGAGIKVRIDTHVKATNLNNIILEYNIK